MAFNIQTFKTRSLTALLFVVVMLGGLLWNQWSFFLLFTIIHFGCWTEYQRLIGRIDPQYTQVSSFHKYGVMLAGWCIMLCFSNDHFIMGGISLHAIGWWLGLIAVFLLPLGELLVAKQIELKNIGYSALGLLYISLSWGLLIDLRCYNMADYAPVDTDWGYILPCGLIFSIWINDTMAYIVGSLIGKTPFSPISPKKNLGRNHRRRTIMHHRYIIIRLLVKRIPCIPLDGYCIYRRCCRNRRRPIGKQAEKNG